MLITSIFSFSHELFSFIEDISEMLSIILAIFYFLFANSFNMDNCKIFPLCIDVKKQTFSHYTVFKGR